MLLRKLLTFTLCMMICTQPLWVFAYSNEAIHWGLKRSTNGQPPSAGKRYDQLLQKFDAFYLGNTNRKEIYLTFDNGYENGYTAQILDVLKEKHVPATFFITGHYLTDQPELVKRMVREGHLVGNHSWHHPDFTRINDEQLRSELTSLNNKYKELTGGPDMVYLRPPRGIFSERTLALSRELGYYHVLWSLAYVDWKVDEQKGSKYAYEQIMNQIHPGAIILLHSVSKDNADALATIIDDLRKAGYEFKSLDHIRWELPWDLHSFK